MRSDLHAIALRALSDAANPPPETLRVVSSSGAASTFKRSGMAMHNRPGGKRKVECVRVYRVTGRRVP